MSSVESTAEVMSHSITGMISKAQTILNFSRSLASFIQQFRSNKNANNMADTPVESVNNTNFDEVRFTGQYSDIAYADCYKSISDSDIRKICKDDNKLYENVINNYRKAVSDGNMRLEVSELKEISFSLTEKGKSLIQQDSFIEQFKKDQINYFCNKSNKNTATVKMTGDKSDINIFRYVDSFNINSVCAGGGKSRIQQMILEWEKYGFVKTDENGNVFATEKCSEYFKQQDVRGVTTEMNVEKVSPSNFKNVAQTANDATKTAEKTARTAKTATDVASKSASVATKAGATTAAGTATAGVSVAATAIVELSQQGNKFLQQNLNLKANKF